MKAISHNRIPVSEEDLSQGGESEDSGIPARKNVNISLTWPSSADNLTHKKTWYIATYHRKVFILRYFGTLFFPLITLKSLALKRRSTLWMAEGWLLQVALQFQQCYLGAQNAGNENSWCRQPS